VKAWVYQDDKQVKKHGSAAASWYVGWTDPEGRRRCQSCGPGKEGRKSAERLRQKREAELVTGTYQSNDRKTWEEFRAAYDAKILDGMGVRNRDETCQALSQFERLIDPKRMLGITSLTVADFVAKRRTEGGMKPGSIISPATVNKELRHLRAVLRKAAKWGYLPKGLPDFPFIKESKKLPTYMPPEHFALLYQACDKARWPDGQAFTPGDWWRGLLMFAYMTGWRIGAMLALRREDVNLDEGTAISLAADNKGKRDQRIILHPVVVDHLRRLPGFSPVYFPWTHGRRQLFLALHALQKAAGIKPEWGKDRYGFHDLRRAFATMNAERLTADALQALMQHKDYQTTQRYIAMARQLKPAAQNLFVPDVGLSKAT
jgi:integrase